MDAATVPIAQKAGCVGFPALLGVGGVRPTAMSAKDCRPTANQPPREARRPWLLMWPWRLLWLLPSIPFERAEHRRTWRSRPRRGRGRSRSLFAAPGMARRKAPPCPRSAGHRFALLLHANRRSDRGAFLLVTFPCAFQGKVTRATARNSSMQSEGNRELVSCHRNSRNSNSTRAEVARASAVKTGGRRKKCLPPEERALPAPGSLR